MLAVSGKVPADSVEIFRSNSFMNRNPLPKTTSGQPSERAKAMSRRKMLIAGATATAGGILVFPTLADQVQAQMGRRRNPIGIRNQAEILNKALFYEHQAIWAYGFAAGKLSNTKVGKTVLELALRNQADHKKHRDAIASAVQQLGSQPVAAQAKYDLSSYISNREGAVDSDVNIAKLALALEVDAAIAYVTEVAELETPALVSAAASIGAAESAHATAIRSVFKAYGVAIEIVPAAFMDARNRNAWVLKV
jgi:rubrerythrin